MADIGKNLLFIIQQYCNIEYRGNKRKKLLPVLKKEISLLNKYELNVGTRSNASVFVAQKEAELFNEELGENKAIAIPNGVDTDYFHNDYKPKQENAIAFLGAMNVAHNENAVLNFINNIYRIFCTYPNISRISSSTVPMTLIW